MVYVIFWWHLHAQPAVNAVRPLRGQKKLCYRGGALPPAFRLLAFALVKTGQQERAAEIVKELLKIEPGAYIFKLANVRSVCWPSALLGRVFRSSPFRGLPE
jgi:hypothetical protein